LVVGRVPAGGCLLRLDVGVKVAELHGVGRCESP
jgi:hypothetical protein